MPELFRPRYHLSAPIGRLNDPNGTYVEDDVLHVYYQHDPQWPEGEKRTGWGHAAIQIDQIEPDEHEQPREWRHFPDALYPLTSLDSHGCYSGCAVVTDDKVELFYTGNAKSEGVRRATQNLVLVDGHTRPDGGSHLRSPLNPLIDGPAPGFTAHYRDPNIFYRDNRWVMLLGAQRENLTGTVVVYTSSDRRTWDFAGEMHFDSSGAVQGSAPDLVPGGFMWECPVLTTLTDEATGQRKDVLIVLPQGLEATGDHYANSDQCGYFVGRFTVNDKPVFTLDKGFSELDRGHEFYAPQVAYNSEPPLLIGWMGLPAQDEQPTKADRWVHTMTLVRELSLRNNVVIQRPITPCGNIPAGDNYGAFLTFNGEFELGSSIRLLDSESETVAQLHIDQRLTLERFGDYRADDSRRHAPLPLSWKSCPDSSASESVDPALIPVQIIVDGSCLEVFIGDGEVVFSSRIFPAHEPTRFSVEATF